MVVYISSLLCVRECAIFNRKAQLFQLKANKLFARRGEPKKQHKRDLGAETVFCSAAYFGKIIFSSERLIPPTAWQNETISTQRIIYISSTGSQAAAAECFCLHNKFY